MKEIPDSGCARGEARLRLFVAVELGSGIQGRLVELQEILRPHGFVRWVRRENLHLTLKFLGEVPRERITRIQEALGRVACRHAPLEIALAGVGAFPDLKRPRVLWVGLSSGQEALRCLAGDLDQELGLLGFQPEARGFVGHITLGRIARPESAPRLERSVQDLEGRPVGSRPVSELCLFCSRLQPAGPVYSVLQRFALGGPAQAVPQSAEPGQ